MRREHSAAASGAAATALLLLVSCAAPPPPPPQPNVAATQPFAKPLSFSILEDYDKGADLDSIARDFALMRELDVYAWRGSFGWDDYEPAAGEYDFAWLRRFVESARRNGIELRPYIAYTPEWAARGGDDGDAWNDPPAELSRWSSFVARLARELRGAPNVMSYEIYNEENAQQWWEGTAAEYAATLDAAAAAIRAEDPSALVLMGGLTYPDTDWLDAVCERNEARERVDVVPFHAYPETWTPEGVTVENYLAGLADFIEAARDGCGASAVWVNETGYATVAGRTEQQQANWWARAIATFAAARGVEHIGIYELRDLSPETAAIGDAPNYHLGLVYNDGRKKLAFHTVDLLTDLLDVDTLVVDDAAAMVRGGDAIHHHLFRRPDGVRVLVLWSSAAGATVRVMLDQPIREVTEEALAGEAVPYGDAAGRTMSNVRLEPGSVRVFAIDR